LTQTDQQEAAGNLTAAGGRSVKISEFQKLIEDIYFDKDSQRGLMETFAWFVEEVGELSRELRSRDDMMKLREEFADVLAWLSTLASLAGIDLEEAAGKYERGCPKCHEMPCLCSESRN
jgi:NTP pyrophosphatase (non-canonical NTP hydrolase)